MTLDEAIKHTEEEREGIEQYIDSISITEPCEDAIGREDALMCLTGEIKEADTIETIIARFVRRIRKLPTVTPQQKIGHWIDDKCSVCGKGIEDLIDSREWYRNEEPNFCPFCGIKVSCTMQESEDKE